MGSGVHTVWGIFRVFYLYNCDEENSFYLRLVIWSWYIGAIIGSCCSGYAVAKYRKGHLYVCINSARQIKYVCWLVLSVTNDFYPPQKLNLFIVSLFFWRQIIDVIDRWRRNAHCQRYTSDVFR